MGERIRDIKIHSETNRRGKERGSMYNIIPHGVHLICQIPRAVHLIVNLQDASGLTPSHMAAIEGHTYCVTVLASHRAYLNLTDSSDER